MQCFPCENLTSFFYERRRLKTRKTPITYGIAMFAILVISANYSHFLLAFSNCKRLFKRDCC